MTFGERAFYIDIRLSQLGTELADEFIGLCQGFAQKHGLEYATGILDNRYRWLIIQEERKEADNENEGS